MFGRLICPWDTEGHGRRGWERVGDSLRYKIVNSLFIFTAHLCITKSEVLAVHCASYIDYFEITEVFF